MTFIKSTVSKTFLIIFICIIFLCLATPAFANSLELTLSDGQAFTLINQVTIINNEETTAKDIYVELPLISNEDVTWQTNLDENFYPSPYKISYAEDGSRVAYYYIESLAPGEEVVLQQTVSVLNFIATYSIIPSYDLEEEVTEVDYLQAEANIDVGSYEITNYAESTTTGLESKYAIARKLFADINLYMSYDALNQLSEQSSIEALKTGIGNCIDYTNIYVATLRTMNIPAKTQEVILYSTDTSDIDDLMDIEGNICADSLRHLVVEFYLSDVGYVVADPTFTQTIETGTSSVKIVDWDRFASISSSYRLLWLGEGNAVAENVNYSSLGQIEVEYHSYVSTKVEYRPFKDIDGHWAYAEILEVYTMQTPLMVGQADGVFAPNASLTRAEAVTIINRLISSGFDVDLDIVEDYEIPDDISGHWAEDEILTALAGGYAPDLIDGSFNPNEPITRAETAVLFYSILNFYMLAGEDFDDVPEDYWASDEIKTLRNLGIIGGIGNNLFDPEDDVTRAEFAAMLSRLFDAL